MKLAIICDSPLLDRCLEYYLRDYVTSYRQCDFIIADKELKEVQKPVCLISASDSAHIQKPFTPSQLLFGVEEFFKTLSIRPSFDEIDESHENYALKCKINEVATRFAEELFWVINEHYEKR
ncbi:MAG: hypothetical protein ACTTJS_00940 [Wolinella sp.]